MVSTHFRGKINKQYTSNCSCIISPQFSGKLQTKKKTDFHPPPPKKKHMQHLEEQPTNQRATILLPNLQPSQPENFLTALIDVRLKGMLRCFLCFLLHGIFQHLQGDGASTSVRLLYGVIYPKRMGRGNYTWMILILVGKWRNYHMMYSLFFANNV